MTALLELSNIRRSYPSGEGQVEVLKDVSLSIQAGEMVAIVGASGSGKSTLMNILGCLDKPTSGTYRVAGRDVSTLDSDALAQLRREHFGFIFQRYHLLSHLTAAQNVEVPAVYAGTERKQRLARAQELLQRLGLGDRVDYQPSQLSGGQQQRVSIARALMNGGQVILADEPTGALDSHSGQEVMSILKDLHARGHTVVIVTHDMQVAEHAQRIIELSDGEIVADRRKTTPHTVARLPISLDNAVSRWQSQRDRLYEAFKMALLAMASQRLRTLLTMLGIIIGIASVVSVVALGNGSQQQLLAQFGLWTRSPSLIAFIPRITPVRPIQLTLLAWPMAGLTCVGKKLGPPTLRLKKATTNILTTTLRVFRCGSPRPLCSWRILYEPCSLLIPT